MVRESSESVIRNATNFLRIKEWLKLALERDPRGCAVLQELYFAANCGGLGRVASTTCIGRLHTTMNNNRYAQTYYDKQHIHFFDLQNACPHTLTPELERREE
jgi:hypothetical protein